MKFIILLIFFLSKISKIVSIKQEPTKSNLYVSVDDIFVSIKINGNEFLKHEEHRGWRTSYH